MIMTSYDKMSYRKCIVYTAPFKLNFNKYNFNFNKYILNAPVQNKCPKKLNM